RRQTRLRRGRVMKQRHGWFAGAMTLLLGLCVTAAGPPATPGANPGVPCVVEGWTDYGDESCEFREPFTAGAVTLQFLSGYYPQTSLGPGGPPFEYIDLVARIGCTLHDPILNDTFFRGSWELLLENHASPVLRSFGSYVVGPGMLLRCNFVQPDAAVVP